MISPLFFNFWRKIMSALSPVGLDLASELADIREQVDAFNRHASIVKSELDILQKSFKQLGTSMVSTLQIFNEKGINNELKLDLGEAVKKTIDIFKGTWLPAKQSVETSCKKMDEKLAELEPLLHSSKYIENRAKVQEILKELASIKASQEKTLKMYKS